MFKSIEGLPADVLAIEATGQITHAEAVRRLRTSGGSGVAGDPARAVIRSRARPEPG